MMFAVSKLFNAISVERMIAAIMRQYNAVFTVRLFFTNKYPAMHPVNISIFMEPATASSHKNAGKR